MHNASTAHETLELLWFNYLALCERADLDSMPQETLEVHIEVNTPVRPFRIATWVARQGYFISAWSLWEYYSRVLCASLRHQKKKLVGESSVDWVARSLSANSRSFTEHHWFTNANCVRNLIAHCGGRIDGAQGERLLQRSRMAFPEMETWQDGYIALEHEHVAELQIKIEEYIRETA